MTTNTLNQSDIYMIDSIRGWRSCYHPIFTGVSTEQQVSTWKQGKIIGCGVGLCPSFNVVLRDLQTPTNLRVRRSVHIVHENPEGCTHAVYMRFPPKEVLAEYYKNTFQSRVLNEYIIPYCHVCVDVGLFQWIMRQK